ncbi:hypothetical protein M433DRAFT_157715 [Acidomyces richmondensis BFW]|nr:hypothetical protein M433DRAFT_157715 [Acidomyces richmondensis BFW]
MPAKQAKSRKTWSMYPELHDDVANLLANDDLVMDFHGNDDPQSSVREKDTTIMGRFRCDNPACKSNGWSSKKVAITIRLFQRQKYNARVYHQRCKSCNWVSRPTLDNSYAERVAYRLKKWQGIRVETPPHSEGNGRPHQRSLCEGCRNGRCREQL